MAILTFKNKELNSFLNARDLSSIANGLIYGTSGVPPQDLAAISSEETFFYSANELVVSLEGVTPEFPPVDESAGFDFFDDLFTAGSGPRRRVPPSGFKFSTPAKIRVNSFWNTVPESDSSNFENYVLFDVEASIVSSASDRISFKILNDKAKITEYYNSIGVRKPEYGLMLVVIEFENSSSGEKFENAYLLKYTHAAIFSSPALFDIAPRPDLGLSYMNRYTSAGYTAETLFVPTLTSSFVYNFYEEEESNYEIYKERSYKNEKLADIPKYVRLDWDKPNLSPADFDAINRVLRIPPGMIGLDLGAGISDATRDAIGDGFRRDEVESIVRRAAESAGVVVGDSTRSALAGAFSSPPPEPPPPPPPPTPSAISFYGLMVPLPSEISDIAAAIAGASRSRESVPRLESSPITDPALEGGDSSPRPPTDPSLLPPPTNVEELFARSSDYIGYVIEKTRLSENAIDYDLIDVIAIPGKDTTHYIDTKIAYGEIYQYKIRTLFRFVNNSNLTMYEDSDALLTKKQSVNFVDTNFLVKTHKTFYYDSPDSTPTEVSIEEFQRPDPPVGVKMFANSRKKNIFVTWNQKNQNRDVVGYNLYRRDLKDSRLLKLNVDLIPTRNNFYVDHDIVEEVDYLYGVESVDIHGNFSKLSAQFYIRTKEIINFDDFSCESKQVMLFEDGREIDEVLPRKEKDDLTIVRKALKININPLFKNTDENNTFIVKITSLDTGIEKFVKLNFRTQTIYHVAPYVPARPPLWIITEYFDVSSELRDALGRFTDRSGL